MNLRIYLAKYNIRKKDFAFQIGVTPVTVSVILSGKSSRKLALKIEAATKGEVKAIDVCPDFHTRTYKPRGWQVAQKERKNDRIGN